MGRMPAAGYVPLPNQYVPVAVLQAAPVPHRYAPVPACPMPQLYYAASVNGRNQHDQYQANRMPNATQDNFQPQRANQYRQQQDDYQRQRHNVRGAYCSSTDSEFTSTIYSGDSRYRRRR
jgi:hypothetical protein